MQDAHDMYVNYIFLTYRVLTVFVWDLKLMQKPRKSNFCYRICNALILNDNPTLNAAQLKTGILEWKQSYKARRSN